MLYVPIWIYLEQLWEDLLGAAPDDVEPGADLPELGVEVLERLAQEPPAVLPDARMRDEPGVEDEDGAEDKFGLGKIRFILGLN